MAAGLDRFLYCYHLGKRTLFKKVYMKQKMCRLLMEESEEALAAPVDGHVAALELVEVKQEDSDEDVDWAALPDVGPKKKRAPGGRRYRLSVCCLGLLPVVCCLFELCLLVVVIVTFARKLTSSFTS